MDRRTFGRLPGHASPRMRRQVGSGALLHTCERRASIIHAPAPRASVTRVAREIVVSAPVERVFDALIDPQQRARWVGSMRESGEGAPLAVGRVVEARRSAPASRSTYRMTVRRLEPARSLEMDVERNGERVGRAGYELAPATDGTRVRAWGEVELRGLQKLAGPIVAKGMEDEIVVDLAGLKKHVESEP